MYFTCAVMILKWERPIFDLHARLEAHADAVSDADARAVIDHIGGHLQTNCDSAAQYLFFSIAPVCRFKPHLTRELLVHAVHPLYYLGINTAADAAVWLRSYVANQEPYAVPSEAGRAWMEALVHDPSPLQTALADVIAHETADDDGNT
jgi:hypothetical protein